MLTQQFCQQDVDCLFTCGFMITSSRHFTPPDFLMKSMLAQSNRARVINIPST